MIEISLQENTVKLTNTYTNESEVVLDLGVKHNNYTALSSQRLYQEYTSMINNYEVIKKYTYGETTLLDIVAITSLVFNELMNGKHTNIRALEVGSWFGCSSYFFANSLKTFSENNILFCMDTWNGSPDTMSHSIANYENAFEHFKSVMRYAGVYESIKPIVCDSTVGMDILQENFFDIIFVDANHTYDYVYQDIVKGIKKIKVGGLLIGHDCECYADELPPHLLHGDNKHLDGIEGYHTGVIKALDDIFGRDYSRFNASLVWYKRITQEDKDMIIQLEKKSSISYQRTDELVKAIKDSIQFIYNSSLGEKTETTQILLTDLVQVAQELENTMAEISGKINNKSIKLKANLLKSALIDYQITYENDFPQALMVLESSVIESFNDFWKCYSELDGSHVE
ncbi:class I SAM-dependent methyltransferase [Paenibacillus sp. 2003]|uniref:class I SAM-dependent methyltransferase n=1 Tax=Paenibacillus TaxID=44249 RepID=UPI002865450D|nr:class I SAM-dependent methyltransferase [Paenibacillus sp. 2003]MDR6720296.1 putative O-methyltransferase YrrM [Paenibacillus sp. 2003]